MTALAIVIVNLPWPTRDRADPVAVIVDPDGAHIQCRKLDKVEQNMIGDRELGYCCGVWSDATGWVLLDPLRWKSP